MNTDAMKPILPFQGEGIEVRSYTQGVGLSLSKTDAVSSVERRCHWARIYWAFSPKPDTAKFCESIVNSKL